MSVMKTPTTPPSSPWPEHRPGASVEQSRVNTQPLADNNRTAIPPTQQRAAVATTRTHQRVQIDPTKAGPVGIMKAHLGVESINPL